MIFNNLSPLMVLLAPHHVEKKFFFQKNEVGCFFFKKTGVSQPWAEL